MAASFRFIEPLGGEVYISGSIMTIQWQATLDTGEYADHVALYYKWSDDSEERYIGTAAESMSQVLNGPYEWIVPSVPTGMRHLQIIAYLGAFDLGTVRRSVSYSVEIISGSYVPSIYLRNPQPLYNGEITLEADTGYRINWDITGCYYTPGAPPMMTISYTTDGGLNYYVITTLDPCVSRSFLWTVPRVDTESARVRLDWEGIDSSVSQYTFRISTSGLPPQSPVADAGPDQTVSERSTVTLDGGSSRDPDGDTLTYLWERVDLYISSYPFTIQNSNTSTPSFVAPDVGSEPKIFSFRLTVSDGDLSDIDTVDVTVTPTGPQITSFSPAEGWYKTPVTIRGNDLAGCEIFMHGVRVETVPAGYDTEYVFLLPEFPLGETTIRVTNSLTGSFTTSDTFDVLLYPYQWDWGFGFRNPGDYFLSWDDYENCFGHAAVTIELCCEWDGPICIRACHDVLAQAIYDEFVRELAWPGSCWGVSVTSLKYYSGSFTEYVLAPGQEMRNMAWSLGDESPWAHEAEITNKIQKDQISQVSAEALDYLLDHIGDTPTDVVSQIQADLDPSHPWRSLANQPGVISIANISPGLELLDIEAHTIIPFHVEQVSPTEWRIYVYDSNWERFSTARDVSDLVELTDLTNIDNYPYITVRVLPDGTEWWDYLHGSIPSYRASTDYSIRISGLGFTEDIPFYGLFYFPASVVVRDHYTLPTSLEGIFMILSGSAYGGIEDSDGNVLGYDRDGQLSFNIADGIPIVPMGDSLFSEQQAYILPNGDYQVNVYGKENGEYGWQCFFQETLFAIEGAGTSIGTTDTLSLGRGNSSLSLQTTDSEKHYSVKIVKKIASGQQTFQRVYEILDTTIYNSDLAVFRVSPDSNSLVYENNSNHVINFNARFTQTQLGPQPEPPDQPSPVEDHTLFVQDLEIPANTTLILTPSDWTKLKEAALNSQQMPAGIVPDIDINGFDDPLLWNQGDPLSVTVRLDAGNAVGVEADWWLVAATPVGLFHFDLLAGGWVPGFEVTEPTFQGPLLNIPDVGVFKLSPQPEPPDIVLPAGNYMFVFGIDTVKNGILDLSQLQYDYAELKVLEASTPND